MSFFTLKMMKMSVFALKTAQMSLFAPIFIRRDYVTMTLQIAMGE